MQYKKKEPNGNQPNVPIDFFVHANPFIDDKKENTSHKKQYKVKVQSLFLAQSSASVFVYF